MIGQVAACNAVSFYRLANAEIAHGILRVQAVLRAGHQREWQFFIAGAQRAQCPCLPAGTIAVTPVNDEMTLVGANLSIAL